MAKVAVTDYTFESLDVEKGILEPLGCELVARQCKTRDELIALTHDADEVIVQFAPVDASVIDAMERCNVIVRYGIGVDNVDLDAAAARNVPVCNVPDYCIDEVADHTLSMILAATRQTVPCANAVRAGQWLRPVPLESMRALNDMTVGVVGFGRIGREVAARLSGFKCSILVHDPLVEESTVRDAGSEPATLEALLRAADLITLHCPSTEQTRHMINAASLARMKKGAILVNTSRGTLVKTDDLVAALQSGQVAAASLDVADPEPVPADSPLLKMDNVVITSHIASSSVRAVHALRTTAAEIVACAVRGEKLPNVVNGVQASG